MGVRLGDDALGGVPSTGGPGKGRTLSMFSFDDARDGYVGELLQRQLNCRGQREHIAEFCDCLRRCAAATAHAKEPGLPASISPDPMWQISSI
jgi:hypothetical protein